MSRKSGKGIDKRRRYMSYADKVFIDMCRDIIDNGTSTEGEKVRPVWEDGTSAYTIKRFGVVNRYDLSKEFPALTLRRTAIKSCVDELLWIWQKKSNNVNELKSHIWDSWADETGSIGKAYGYQMGVKHQYKEGRMDQTDRVIFDLKNNPYMDEGAAAGHRRQGKEPAGVGSGGQRKDGGAGGADRPHGDGPGPSGGHRPAFGHDFYQCGGGRDAGADRGRPGKAAGGGARGPEPGAPDQPDPPCADHHHRQLLPEALKGAF